MREMESTITQKGQVTIPAEIRRALGIKKGDRVAFVIEGDRVWLMFEDSVAAAPTHPLARAQSLIGADLGALRS